MENNKPLAVGFGAFMLYNYTNCQIRSVAVAGQRKRIVVGSAYRICYQVS